jgi:hypothetical protein
LGYNTYYINKQHNFKEKCAKIIVHEKQGQIAIGCSRQIMNVPCHHEAYSLTISSVISKTRMKLSLYIIKARGKIITRNTPKKISFHI